MRKILFFDNWNLLACDGFIRKVHKAQKCGQNPLYRALAPWEGGNLTFYGTVIHRADLHQYQLWYTSIEAPWVMRLGYLESADGINFVRPEFSVHLHNGQKTNIVQPNDLHGSAIIYDEREPQEDKRYKMLAGIGKKSVQAFFSGDGIHWRDAFAYPVIHSKPDSPMALCRLPSGKYLASHRVSGHGRRVYVSQSWDFEHWGEPQLVYEPDPADPAGTQIYGMGISSYGGYLLGTPWLYHVDPSDTSTMSGLQETELAYAREVTAWHRIAAGTPLIEGGISGTWEAGNVQMSSRPVYLEREIRFYYAATTQAHAVHWELCPQSAGVGMASLRPDGFVSLEAGEEGARMRTYSYPIKSRRIVLNAKVSADGWLKIRLLDSGGRPIAQSELQVPAGDHLDLSLFWPSIPAERALMEIDAKNASVYAISLMDREDETYVYHAFELPEHKVNG